MEKRESSCPRALGGSTTNPAPKLGNAVGVRVGVDVVGSPVGANEGLAVVGLTVGADVGRNVGAWVGLRVVGVAVGTGVTGAREGRGVGASVGTRVGRNDGAFVGNLVGRNVGAWVGLYVTGSRVGLAVCPSTVSKPTNNVNLRSRHIKLSASTFQVRCSPMRLVFPNGTGSSSTWQGSTALGRTGLFFCVIQQFLATEGRSRRPLVASIAHAARARCYTVTCPLQRTLPATRLNGFMAY